MHFYLNISITSYNMLSSCSEIRQVTLQVHEFLFIISSHREYRSKLLECIQENSSIKRLFSISKYLQR